MAGPGTTQPSSTDAGVPAALLDDNDPALFPKLSDSQLDLLAKHGHVRAITAGEVLFRYGDTAYPAMVLLDGRVAVLMGTGEPERALTIHQPRDLMIELSLLTGEPVHATGVVREAGSMLVVPAQEFRAVLGSEPGFGDFVLQMLFRRRKAILPPAPTRAWVVPRYLHRRGHLSSVASSRNVTDLSLTRPVAAGSLGSSPRAKRRARCYPRRRRSGWRGAGRGRSGDSSPRGSAIARRASRHAQAG